MKSGIEFTRAPIAAPPLDGASREIGACVEFSGIVRSCENGRQIAGLTYEAYEPMARAELEKLFRQLSALHACDAALFIHRLGFVPVGETSLFIRALARHRQPALRFTEELIDRLKKDVPIWKSA